MATQKGISTIIHLNIGGKRTTASMDTTLADLVCLKLDNKLSNDAGKTLTEWAKKVCADHQINTITGISARIRMQALLFICDDETRKRWMNA